MTWLLLGGVFFLLFGFASSFATDGALLELCAQRGGEDGHSAENRE